MAQLSGEAGVQINLFASRTKGNILSTRLETDLERPRQRTEDFCLYVETILI